MSYRRTLRDTKHCWQLLKGITFTLPFLFVRTLYSVLSSFAPFPATFVDGQEVLTEPSDSGLGRFSSFSSDWWIYLVMAIVMEYCAVLIYVTVGLITPLSKDLPDYSKAASYSDSRAGSSEAFRMGAYSQGPYAPGQQQYVAQPQQYYGSR